VTMMEPGCSNIVSVSFNDVAETQSDKELSNAIASKRKAVDSNEKLRNATQGPDKRQDELALDESVAESGDESSDELSGAGAEVIAEADFADRPEENVSDTEDEAELDTELDTDDTMEASQ
jgi:hypothetical protein